MRAVLTPGDSTYYDETLKWLTSKYGKKTGLFLTNRLAKMIRQTDDYCMDNFRVAEEGTPEMKTYEQTKKNGCCGFNDEKFIFKEKTLFGIKERVFWMGYNYGH